MKDFKFFSGQEIDDLGLYIRNYHKLNPDIQIFIGTDSSKHGRTTKYATVVSLLRPGRGVHVIYKTTNINREMDLFTRLWNETEFTREVGEYVHESVADLYNKKDDKKIPTLHLDFNKSPKYKSFMVHDLSMGYLKGFGFNVYSKSDSWTASVAADWLVN